MTQTLREWLGTLSDEDLACWLVFRCRDSQELNRDEWVERLGKIVKTSSGRTQGVRDSADREREWREMEQLLGVEREDEDG